MQKKELEKSPFSQLAHITIAVKDMERAVKFYSSLGIGPFVQNSHHTFVTRTLRGKPVTGKRITREASIGPVMLQLVQYVDGEHLIKEFIDKKGEGVFHLGFLVDDIDKAEDKAVKLGLKVTQRARRADGSGNAFFDTETLGGVILEIKQNPVRVE